VRADLTRCGQFGWSTPATAHSRGRHAVDLAQWRARGPTPWSWVLSRTCDGDSTYGSVSTTTERAARRSGLRRSGRRASVDAHRIADRIYREAHGRQGRFATRIAYECRFSKDRLRIADRGRRRPPIRKPRCDRASRSSPDLVARGTCFRTFRSRPTSRWSTCIPWRPARAAPLPISRAATARRAFSPDGKTWQSVLTKDGNSEIYLIGVDGTNPRRLTVNDAIDTSRNSRPTAPGSTSRPIAAAVPRILPDAGGRREAQRNDINETTTSVHG